MASLSIASRIEALAAKRLGVSRSPSFLQEKLIVRCSPRLESLLRRELVALSVLDHEAELSMRPGAIECLARPGSYQSVCLLSRLADRVHLCLGNPIDNVKSPMDVYNYAMSLPWSKYILAIAGMELPSIRVASKQSEMTGRDGNVINRVVAALKVHMKAALEESGDYPATAQEMEQELRQPFKYPSIQVEIIRNVCQIMVDCSGLLGVRNWKCEEDKKIILHYSNPEVSRTGSKPLQQQGCTRARLLDSQFAAIVLKSPFLKTLSTISENETLVLWDPFCNSGGLLLEAVGVVLGLTPDRGVSRPFPFMNFPCVDLAGYRELRSELSLQPHPFWRRLKIFGSDGFTPDPGSSNVKMFHTNLERFMTLVEQSHLSQNKLSSEMTNFIQRNLVISPGLHAEERCNIAPQNCFILTAIPFKSDGMRSSDNLRKHYKDFGKLISSRRSQWRGVFVAAVASSRFKELSRLNWITHAIFEHGSCLGGGPAMELLEWSPN